MNWTEAIVDCWKFQWKLLTFRATTEELLTLGKRQFFWGIFWVWVTGIGRSWDDTTKDLLVKAGLPSVIYVFILALFLWIVIGIMRPQNWSYRRLLTLICMTGIIGMLYAIPVEMMFPEKTAELANSVFLIIVSIWRVALLGFFLFKTTAFHPVTATVALFLPLFMIVNFLLMTEYMERTFNAMAGIRHFAVIVDKERAEKAFAMKKEKKTVTLRDTPIAHGNPQAYSDMMETQIGVRAVPNTSDKSRGTLYESVHGTFPEGFKEVDWDDLEYNPPTTTFRAFIRILSRISRLGLPFLGVYFLAVVVLRNVLAAKRSLEARRQRMQAVAE